MGTEPRITPLLLALLALFASVGGLGCQAATVTGPGWGEDSVAPKADSPDAAAPVEEDGRDPEQVFLELVLPLLDDRCNGCHADAARAPVFIDPEDPYLSILDSGVVVIGEPTTSTVITRGAHRGPAWRTDEEPIVADWISLEGSAEEPEEGSPPPPSEPAGEYETSPQAIVAGSNVIELDGVGLPGAELRFFAQRVSLGLHMSGITLYGGSQGLDITHPTFIAHDEGTRQPDPDDRFAALELLISAADEIVLAENVLLVDFPLEGELSIDFESASTL